MHRICGRSSSGRAPPCQGGGSEFEPRRPLQHEAIVDAEMQRRWLFCSISAFRKTKGAVAHATASIFVRIGVRIKQYQCPKQKHVQQIFSKIRNFRWICDAHAFSNYLIIRLILKMTSALSAKTMCNSPFLFWRLALSVIADAMPPCSPLCR